MVGPAGKHPRTDPRALQPFAGSHRRADVGIPSVPGSHAHARSSVRLCPADRLCRRRRRPGQACAGTAKPAAQQLTPEQRAAIQKRDQELVSYANQILKMIDNGQSAQVWDDMSEVGKKVVTRAAFEKK